MTMLLARSAMALALLSIVAAPVRAGTIYESATYTGTDPGDYVVQAGRLIGARFSVTAATQVTGIGAGFGQNPGGTIFGAIIPLASPGAYPSVGPGALASISLGDVVFAVPAGINDVLEPLSVALNPGEYAVVFGSGLFGAMGFAGLSDGNTTIGTPSFFQSLYGPSWQPQSADGIRVVVDGSPIAEPGTLALLAAALTAGVAALRRRAA